MDAEGAKELSTALGYLTQLTKLYLGGEYDNVHEGRFGSARLYDVCMMFVCQLLGRCVNY